MKIEVGKVALAFSQLCVLFSSADDEIRRSLRADSQRIIGGSEAVEDRYSYAVLLQDKQGPFCGGSLIAKDVVLTAAHCQGAPFDVLIGRHDLDDRDGQIIGIKKQMPHPSYNDRNTDNDFMLVFLQKAATANVDLVKVNSVASRPSVGNKVTVMGWGDTDIRDSVTKLSDALQMTQVNVISNNEW